MNHAKFQDFITSIEDFTWNQEGRYITLLRYSQEQHIGDEAAPKNEAVYKFDEVMTMRYQTGLRLHIQDCMVGFKNFNYQSDQNYNIFQLIRKQHYKDASPV